MLYLPFGIPDYKHKNTISPFFYLLLSSISLSSILSPLLLYSVFFSVPFSPSLSHFTTSIPHVLNCLSLLIAHSAPPFLSFHLIPVLSLLVPTTKSLALSYFLFYLDSLILSLLSYLSVYLSLSLSSTFIPLPLALNLSTSSLAYPFL
jgi:hypothetical protein